MRKNILLLIIFFWGIETISSAPREENIIIRNYSSKTVIITREFIVDVSDEKISWQQDISDDKYDLFMYVTVPMTNERRLLPNKQETIISYRPWATASFSFDGQPYEFHEYMWKRFNQIPFIEKMNNIFKSLKITTEDGSKVITLENLKDQIIKKHVPPAGIGATYIIEIFEYDLEGRPASEW